MLDFLAHLFDTSDFPPRWECGNWSAGHGWLHVLADLGVWSAYVAIPVVLGFFVARRRDIPFRSLTVLFAAFILLCGATHLLEAVMFWWPAYRLAGVVKLLAAVVSWATVVALARTAPRLLALRGPGQLERANRELADELEQGRAAAVALRESEERFRSLVEATTAIVWNTPASGEFETPQYGWTAFTGQSFDQLRGWGWLTAVHPDDRPNTARVWAAAVAARVIYRVEHRLRRADGSYRHMSVRAVPILTPTGEIREWVGIHTDVTEQKQAETELRLSRERYEVALAGSRDGIWDWDLRTNEVYYSARWKGMLGYADDEVANRFDEWQRLVHPDDLPRADAAVRSYLDGSAPDFGLEVRMRHKDGSYRWIYTRGVALRGRDGKPYRMAGSHTDVTQRKADEEELRRTAAALGQQTKLLRAIVNCVGEGLVVADEHGKFVIFNPTAERILGAGALDITPAEWSGRYHLFLPDGVTPYPPGELPLSRALRGESADGAVVLVRRLDPPRDVWIEVTGRPLRDEDGAGRGGVVVFRDTTDERRAAAALRQYADEVAESRDRIERQAAELVRRAEELRTAKEAAEAASRAKSEFLANMSHEIRTPMNGVLGMTELLLDTDLTPEQREFLGLVKESGETLLRVINDILDFSKVEAGKLELDHVPFRLRESVVGAVRPLAFRAAQKDLELTCHVAPDVPEAVVGDPGRLRQILVNLVGNAIKFTDRGEVAVSVQKADDRGPRVGQEPPPADVCRLRFSVRDTGVGIPADRLRPIFEAFQQGDLPPARSRGGTGLGLAITERLVGLMGGRVWAESEVGTGSTFHVEVPFPVAADAPVPAEAPPPALAGADVLVADDHPTNRLILTETLSAWGAVPTAVPGGPEAVGAVEEAWRAGRPFRLVLLDARMPVLDGFGVAAALRDRPGRCGPVLLLTSADDPGGLTRARELGVAATLVKPVGQADLLAAVGRALVPAPAVRPADRQAAAAPRRLRVLVAEDQPVNQRLVARLLEGRGHEAVIVGDGRQALDRLAAERFDAVLMDVQMPVLDGLAATARLRELERPVGRHTPVIALTAYAMSGDRERCLAAGCDGYLSKPVGKAELFPLLEALADRFPPPPGPAPQTPPAAGDSPARPVFDRAAALARVDGDADFLAELVRLFLDHWPQQREGLREAVWAGEAAAAQRTAHAVKGSLAALGAQAAFEAARALEMMAKAGSLDGAPELLARLEEEVDRFAEAADGR